MDKMIDDLDKILDMLYDLPIIIDDDLEKRLTDIRNNLWDFIVDYRSSLKPIELEKLEKWVESCKNT
jgi:hypothetical protein